MLEDLLRLLQAGPIGILHYIEQTTDPQALQMFQGVVQWSAILLSALAGAYTARKYGTDVYGTLAVTFISCVGGGTIRDLLLDRHPIFWLAEPIYLVTILIVALLGVSILWRAEKDQKFYHYVRPVEQMLGEQSTLFLLVDALALGLWAYLGTLYALLSAVPPITAPVMGVITASFGSVLRDIILSRIPVQFMPGQLYTVAAALGATVYLFLWWWDLGGAAGFLMCLLVTFSVRMASVKFNISTF